MSGLGQGKLEVISQVRSNQVIPVREVRSGLIRTKYVWISQVRLGQSMLGSIESGQVILSYNWSGHVGL